MLDSASDVNFITTSLAQKLKFTPCKTILHVQTLNGQHSELNQYVTTKVKSRTTDFQANLKFLIIPNIVGQIPSTPLSLKDVKIPTNLPLADPHFHVPANIDVLIGKDLFFNLLCVGRQDLPSIILVKTLLGWLVTAILQSAMARGVVKTLSCAEELRELNQTVEQFWEIEHVKSNVVPRSLEEVECERVFKTSTTRTDEGRFVTKLPWKATSKKLGPSRELALKRFLHLENKFKRNSKLKEDYVRFMDEYVDLGHMKEVSFQDDVNCYYIPHHAVMKEASLTTKLRVVFDASAKTATGESLNDLLLVGPQIQVDLFSILTRFRLHKYAMTADVTKIYHQILLHPDEKRYHRILWRRNSYDELKTFELQTVTYGTAPASFLATRCLHELAILAENSHPNASRIIMNDFYVDDLLTGADTLEEAFVIQREVTAILANGGMQLRKWSSNSSQLLQRIPNAIDDNNFLLSWDKTESIKTLGLNWNPRSDSIDYYVSIHTNLQPTKRNILSSIAQIFDPLGLMGPIITIAKLIMQDIWKLKLHWDESLPQNIHGRWLKFSNQLASFTCKIPRFLNTTRSTVMELHGFSDASQVAYGAAIYVKSQTSYNVYTALLCAKSRVAPLKTVSLPRLELCAAVLLAQLMQKVKMAIGMKEIPTWYYTDSTITLAWI